MPNNELQFTAIPIFSSNYVWMIVNTDENQCYVVDPGSAQPVLEVLEQTGIQLKGLLITHSHNDHIGGIDDVLAKYDVPVFGPDCTRIPHVTQALNDADSFELWPGICCSVMHLPGHLPEHIVFRISDTLSNPALFCGDVMFSSGCGRMFSGPADVFYRSLMKIAALDENTEIYCAHEYTEANLEFARYIEPNNADIKQKSIDTASRLSKNGTSLPTTVASERLTNPFIRAHLQEVRAQVAKHVGHEPKTAVAAFAALRGLKDTF